MATLYDSGWIPQLSGAISATVPMDNADGARVIYAVSGASGSVTATLGWLAGLSTPLPWNKAAPVWPTSPLLSGVFPGIALTALSANTNSVYYFGIPTGSGTIVASTYVPENLTVSLQVSGSSSGRIVVEGV